MNRNDDDVDDFDSDKGRDNAAEAIEPQIAPQQCSIASHTLTVFMQSDLIFPCASWTQHLFLLLASIPVVSVVTARYYADAKSFAPA